MPHQLADLRGVSRIVRVDGDGGVAQHRLGPGGGHHHLAGTVGERIGELVQLALRPLVVVNLQIRKGRATGRAPVDEAARPIDEALFVQAHEGLDDGRRVAGVHREDGPLPVERAAELLELVEDPIAGSRAPVPQALDESLPSDVVPALPLLFAQLALDHHLRRDPGVVGAGQPHGVVGRHPPPAGEDVLDRVAERVPDVQRPGDVRRRDDNRERRLGRGGVGVKVSARHPFGVPAGFDLGGLVALRQVGHRSRF